MIRSTCSSIALAVFVSGFFAGSANAASPMLDIVKARGTVRCGVSTGFPGFALPDSQGIYRGLDVDVCRAVAAAVFGDAARCSMCR